MKKIILALLLPLLSACPQPIPCPPLCLTPPPGPVTVTPSPVVAESATATPTPRPPTPVPPPEVSQATEGRAVIEVDLTDFRPAPPLDYYALATFMWDPADRQAPALELSVRGLSPEPCVATPCGPSSLGLVVRESGDILHDGQTPDEHAHCGQGVNYSRRLPIMNPSVFRVTVEWGPWGWRVVAPGGEVTLQKGAPRVGLGAVFFPLPTDRGIGWARHPWTLQHHGGSARLVSWQTLTEGTLSACP